MDVRDYIARALQQGVCTMIHEVIVRIVANCAFLAIHTMVLVDALYLRGVKSTERLGRKGR